MYRAFIFSITAISLLSACSFTSAKGTSLPEATIQPADTTSAPDTSTSTPVTGTQTPTSVPVMQTPTPQPVLTTEWLNQLEIIQPKNWARLQLLKTLPAEIPLNGAPVAISPDGKTMVIGTTQLIFFDIENWQISQTVRVSDGKYFRFLKLEFLSDGTLMASSSGPYAIYHMDSAGHVLSTWNGMGFAVSADDITIAFGENEGTVLVDIASNETMITLNGNYALDSSFSPDNSKIAIDVVGVETATTDIWDLTSQTRLTTLNQTGNARYSPNGKFLAVTAYDEDTNPLKIFSPDGATLITTLKVSDPNQLNGSAPVFSPDGLIIAAQIAIGSPIAWDTTNWQLLENPVLQGNLDSISADGRILITRTSDGGILIWGVLP